MTSTPSFSVVTISYRDLPGLRRTMDSVRAQQYDGPIEHIVIDGGSGDDVVHYLAEHESGLAYWQSRPDAGRYDAMNKGLAHASNDVIWMMHSGDTFSDPGAVAAVADRIAGLGPARDLWGYALADRIGPDGRSVGLWDSIPFDLTKFSMGEAAVPHQATYFGSSVCAAIGEYDLDFGLAADQLYILRAALRQPPVTLRRVVCNFDTTGAGSVLPISDIYANVRRAWDLLGYYPRGSRSRSLAHLRYREYRTRSLYTAYGVAKAIRN